MTQASGPTELISVEAHLADILSTIRVLAPIEVGLTDALLTLAKMSPDQGGGVHGVLFHGRRYDTGNKLDYLRTLVMFASERPDLAQEFVPWLRKHLESLS